LPRRTIFIDPVVTPLSVDSGGGAGCDGRDPRDQRQTGRLSHGLRREQRLLRAAAARTLLNRVFLCQAIAAGSTARSLTRSTVRSCRHIYAAEALAGRDEWCAGYLAAYRRGVL
jgi:hypothetical protein